MAVVSPPVTVKILKALQSAGKAAEVADGACPGLRIRAGAAGTMTWSLLARDSDGVRKRIEVGEWPAIGIPEAREIASQFKAAIKREKAPPAQITLGDVVTLYGKGPGGELPSWKEAERCTRKVFASLMDERAGPITLHQLQKEADKYKAKSSAGAAVRYIKPILKWAAKRGYVQKGVAVELEQPQRPQKRSRVLSDDELRAVLPNLGTTGHDGAARMMLLTACRREEVCAMRFEDIIEDVWHVPGDIRKNGDGHRVPLSQQAQRIVGAQGRTSGMVFVGDKGGRLQNWNRWQKAIYEKTGTEGWHRHDLRRTAATLLGKNGVPPFVVEMVLGHKDAHTELASIYNQSRYDKEVEDALILLGDLLQGIERGSP